LERDLDAVVRDVRDELVSPEAAAAQYGVVVASDGRAADVDSTIRLRQRLRDARRRAVAAQAGAGRPHVDNLEVSMEPRLGRNRRRPA
jgi:hypothetical protein